MRGAPISTLSPNGATRPHSKRVRAQARKSSSFLYCHWWSIRAERRYAIWRIPTFRRHIGARLASADTRHRLTEWAQNYA